MKIKKEKSINLYRKELVSSRFPKRLILGIFLSVFLILFAWFGIVDRYITINSLEGKLSEAISNLEIIEASKNEIGYSQDDYLRYSKAYLSTKERGIASRIIVFEKIDKYLINDADVAKLQLTNNELVITLYGASMQSSSLIINNMLADTDGEIEYAKTKNAKHETNLSTSSVDMTVVFAGEESESVTFEE